MSVDDGDVRRVGPRRQTVDILLAGFEAALYGIAFLMLLAAAVLAVVGGVFAVVQSVSRDGGVFGAGVLVLDRVLLVVIVAELAYTLRAALQDREIVAEPFLLIGMIAIIRRVLILTAELEQSPSGDRVSQLLWELGGLSLMVLAIALAVLMLRYSAKNSVLPHLRVRARSSDTSADQRGGVPPAV